MHAFGGEKYLKCLVIITQTMQDELNKNFTLKLGNEKIANIFASNVIND
jgi:hypothetical protein